VHTSSRIYSSFATQAQTSSSNLDKWLTINDLEEVEVIHTLIGVECFTNCQRTILFQAYLIYIVQYLTVISPPKRRKSLASLFML
jgi:hypothetical protein